jgi:hypothetical protein
MDSMQLAFPCTALCTVHQYTVYRQISIKNYCCCCCLSIIRVDPLIGDFSSASATTIDPLSPLSTTKKKEVENLSTLYDDDDKKKEKKKKMKTHFFSL